MGATDWRIDRSLRRFAFLRDPVGDDGMPQQMLNAQLKKQLANLTQRDKNNLLHIVDECIERYCKVRNMQRKQRVDRRWRAAAMALETSLHRLKNVIDVPSEFQATIKAIIDVGPIYHSPPDTPQRLVNAWKEQFDEMADNGRLFLEELRRVLRAMMPRGEPGRKQKYPESAFKLVRRLHQRKVAWKDVYAKCKSTYPQVSWPKFKSFKRHMERVLKEGD
jgi:hypothetical protein